MIHAAIARALVRLHRDESGAVMVEYGIIAAGIAVPCLIGLGFIIKACSGVLTTTMTNLLNYATQ